MNVPVILRRRRPGVSPLAIYAVLGIRPELVLDFDDEKYFANSLRSTFSNAITHSATTNATMVDSDGLLKWRPHNLVLRSEEFDVGYSGTATLTSGVSDPNGGSEAFTLTSATTNAFFRPSSGITVTPEAEFTLSVFHRNLVGSASIGAYDVSNGAVIGTQSITNTTGEWALTEYNFTTPVGCNSIYVYVANNMSNGASVDAFGMHLYRSDLGGMVNNPDRGDSYVPTTSSAVYLPRRGHHVYNGTSWVNEGLLHESEQRVNLVEYSNSFGGAGWVRDNFGTASAPVVSATNILSPDGTNNASAIVFDTGAGATAGDASRLLQNPLLSLNAVPHTGSVWLKVPSGSAVVELLISGAADSTRDIVVTDTWTRFDTTGTPSSAFGFAVIVRGDTTPGSTTLHIYGAQLEAGSTPSSYIPNAGATSGVTRAAETLTVPSAKLPWPTPVYIGPELVTNGTFDTDTSGWTNNGMSTFEVQSGRLRITANANADSVYQDVTTVSGKVYLLTFDYEQVGGDSLYDGSGVQWTASSITGTGSVEHYFVGTGSDRIEFAEGGPGNDADFYLDNISVREIDPLAVSIQMQGRMTYADEDAVEQIQFLKWEEDLSNRIYLYINTNSTKTGEVTFLQRESGTQDFVQSSTTAYSPGINVPFNIASRHGSTFVNGSVGGTALTADTTPTALPDLSSTDLQLGFDMMGTIKLFRVWSADLGDSGIAEASA